MKKLRFLPLLILLLTCLCVNASAASISGQQRIAMVTDSMGQVTALTDDNPATAWTRQGSADVDLTINLYGGSVGEIWIRNGYTNNQSWYQHYDRPDTVKVTVHYYANQYTTSYDIYRYRLVDSFRSYSNSSSWKDGYQRLLLPKQYTGVTKIELTIESTINGTGRTGATISDIIVAAGQHATATPRTYATATPKPYIVYVTPTPGPNTDDDLVEFITPPPATDDNVEVLTPVPTEPLVETITSKPTAPVVEVITPNPTAQPTPTREPIEYPSSGGVIGTLTKRAATRSGPGTRYDEPGSFFDEGDEVKVISKGYSAPNSNWWYQIEFKFNGKWYRAYTPVNRVNVDDSLVPVEPSSDAPLDSKPLLRTLEAHIGPGTEYLEYRGTYVYEGVICNIYAIENGWVQIEYTDYALEDTPLRRGWVPMDAIYPN